MVSISSNISPLLSPLPTSEISLVCVDDWVDMSTLNTVVSSSGTELSRKSIVLEGSSDVMISEVVCSSDVMISEVVCSSDVMISEVVCSSDVMISEVVSSPSSASVVAAELTSVNVVISGDSLLLSKNLSVERAPSTSPEPSSGGSTDVSKVWSEVMVEVSSTTEVISMGYSVLIPNSSSVVKNSLSMSPDPSSILTEVAENVVSGKLSVVLSTPSSPDASDSVLNPKSSTLLSSPVPTSPDPSSVVSAIGAGVVFASILYFLVVNGLTRINSSISKVESVVLPKLLSSTSTEVAVLSWISCD